MQTKRNIIILAVVFIFVSIIFLLCLIYQKRFQTITQKNVEKINQENIQKKEKQEIIEIKSQKGILKNVDIGKITVYLPDKNENLDLKIPNNKKVSFISQSQQDDGTFWDEEIGLFDLPLNKEAEIQYDSVGRELMMVTVLE